MCGEKSYYDSSESEFVVTKKMLDDLAAAGDDPEKIVDAIDLTLEELDNLVEKVHLAPFELEGVEKLRSVLLKREGVIEVDSSSKA